MTTTERVITILTDSFTSVETITAESNLIDDLYLDGIDIVDLVNDLEDEFDIEIDDAAMSSIATVADVVKVVEAAAGGEVV